MYLSKVILQDFQSHTNSEFIFDKGLNCIIGLSNVGKTSLARALSCVLFNSWQKSWVRSGAKFARITLQTSTGVEIIREKGDKVNRYILKMPNEQSQTFESFGTSVPEAIQQALKIHEIQIDPTDSINLNQSLQLESLFMLSRSGGQNAKILGKLSGAHYLDFAIRTLNVDSRRLSGERSFKEKELTELQGQVDKLSPIEGLSTIIEGFEQKLASVAQREGRLEAIRSLLERVKIWKATWTKEAAIEAVLGQVQVSNFDSLVQKAAKLSTLSLLLHRFTNCDSVFQHQNKLRDLLVQVDVSKIPGLVERATGLSKSKDLLGKITRNNTDIVIKSTNLQKVECQHEEAKIEYNNILKEAGTCPICNRTTADICQI